MAASRLRVTLSAAISIDGKIATRTGDSALSSRKDLARVHRLRASHDAILVGINTVRIDDPLLTVRYAKGDNPVRVILDTRASLCPTSQIAKTARRIQTIVVSSHRAPKRRVECLRKLGIEVIVSARSTPSVKTILGQLWARNIRSVLVEGGSTINWEFVRHNLVDQAVICIVPRFVGGGLSLVGGTGFARIAASSKMRLRSAAMHDGTLIMRYSKL